MNFLSVGKITNVPSKSNRICPVSQNFCLAAIQRGIGLIYCFETMDKPDKESEFSKTNVTSDFGEKIAVMTATAANTIERLTGKKLRDIRIHLPSKGDGESISVSFENDPNAFGNEVKVATGL